MTLHVFIHVKIRLILWMQEISRSLAHKKYDQNNNSLRLMKFHKYMGSACCLNIYRTWAVRLWVCLCIGFSFSAFYTLRLRTEIVLNFHDRQPTDNCLKCFGLNSYEHPRQLSGHERDYFVISDHHLYYSLTLMIIYVKSF